MSPLPIAPRSAGKIAGEGGGAASAANILSCRHCVFCGEVRTDVRNPAGLFHEDGALICDRCHEGDWEQNSLARLQKACALGDEYREIP